MALVYVWIDYGTSTLRPSFLMQNDSNKPPKNPTAIVKSTNYNIPRRNLILPAGLLIGVEDYDFQTFFVSGH